MSKDALEKIRNAASKEEAMELIGKLKDELTEDELDQISGGKCSSAGGGSGCKDIAPLDKCDVTAHGLR